MSSSEIAGCSVRALVELITHNGTEHVQHVVTPIAAAGETLRGLPELGRRVLEDPRGDDLMHREMQLGVDRLTSHLDLGRPVLDPLPEPRVLRRDQQPPIIFVPRVQERDIHVVENIVSRPEQPPDAAFSVVHAGSVATRCSTAATTPTSRRGQSRSRTAPRGALRITGISVGMGGQRPDLPASNPPRSAPSGRPPSRSDTGRSEPTPRARAALPDPATC